MGAAEPAELIDVESPEFQEKAQGCAEQLGGAPDEAAMWRCLGLGERYDACRAEEEEPSEPILFAQCMGLETPDTMPLAKLSEGIALRHPLDMLTLARRSFEKGADKSQGLFWFYASQLRWRTRLSCREFPPGGEGALYGAMFATLGPLFNEWAAQNTDVWLVTLDDVHAWDIATKERYPEDAECLAEAEEQRAGMMRLKQEIIDSRADAKTGEPLTKRENAAPNERPR